MVSREGSDPSYHAYQACALAIRRTGHKLVGMLGLSKGRNFGFEQCASRSRDFKVYDTPKPILLQKRKDFTYNLSKVVEMVSP